MQTHLNNDTVLAEDIGHFGYIYRGQDHRPRRTRLSAGDRLQSSPRLLQFVDSVNANWLFVTVEGFGLAADSQFTRFLNALRGGSLLDPAAQAQISPPLPPPLENLRH